MSGVESRSRVADLVLARLAEVLERLAAIERRLAEVADDVDAIDRHSHPYGDGTKPARRRGGR